MSVSAHVIHPPGVISCFVASTVVAVYASTIAKHKAANRSAFRLFDDVIQLLPKKMERYQIKDFKQSVNEMRRNSR